MTAPGTKICRHCVHAVWQMSPSGKTISRVLPGRCNKSGVLANSLDQRPFPCVMVKVITGFIWPTSNAKTCPSYQRNEAAK
jgi:hypothetical protein